MLLLVYKGSSKQIYNDLASIDRNMSEIYFTADLHLGHKRILEMYPERPFAAEIDIDKHDAYVIGQWNKVVKKHDDVYILGDFSLRSVEDTHKILAHLNGRKYLCPGNHDSVLKSLYNYFEKVEQIMPVRFKTTRCPDLQADLELVLSHYPLLEWPGMHHDVYHLHGHCHGKCETADARRMDVGIDATKQILIPIYEVIAYFQEHLKT